VPTTQSILGTIEEIADFLASCPAPDELLRFRPSPQTQTRAEELLEKLKDGCLSAELERRQGGFRPLHSWHQGRTEPPADAEVPDQRGSTNRVQKARSGEPITK